jgi:hypothetical protein
VELGGAFARPAILYSGRKLGDGRIRINVQEFDIGLKVRTDAGDQFHDTQRIRAEREKVIVRSNLAAPQNGCAKGGKR